MKITGLLSMILLAGLVRADIPPIPDPDMELDDSLSGSTPEGITFGFDAGPNGGGILPFENNSGVDWIGLTITAPWPGGVFNCPQARGTGAFAFCKATFNTDFSMIKIVFSGVGDIDPEGNSLHGLAFGPDPEDGDGDFFHGIPAGQHFSINLNNQTISEHNEFTRHRRIPDVGGWLIGGSPVHFDASADTAVPEPADFELAAFTILASLILCYSRLRKRA